MGVIPWTTLVGSLLCDDDAAVITVAGRDGSHRIWRK